MRRLLEQALVEWAQAESRMPLVLRGARQVGKSHLVEAFGHQYFKHLVTLNLEKNPEYAECFATFNPKDIVTKISMMLGKSIIAGETLLFIDEIQSCPRALQALRYFKEEMPDLHVIAAGSLLEFALNAPDFKMPVGRVQYVYLKPLSFIEFLLAQGKDMWVKAIQSATIKSPMPDVLHKTLCEQVKVYMAIGGMPAVIDSYINAKDSEQPQRMQRAILETYIDDFAKYASQSEQHHVRTVFDQMPLLVGQQTKYNKIDPDTQARFLKKAIHCLQLAGIIYTVYATSASGIPLSALMNLKKYKLFFLDVGLIAAKSGLSAELLMGRDLLLVNRGAMAEQFVCQELLASENCYQRAESFYWQRDKKGSKAEVDFVMQHEDRIVPIEVKAGAVGRLKSLQIMMKEKQLQYGVRISELPLEYDKASGIANVPLYMISELARLL